MINMVTMTITRLSFLLEDGRHCANIETNAGTSNAMEYVKRF